ncbi:hypothetical protein B0H19DRAFT_1169452 [Mycena capillaripes]|nr:hypothetical protein B0H19DRAFT_1169452 [Mycena capillaripes]
MAPTKSNTSPTVPKKKRSSGGLKRKKPTAYNKFISKELARLKEIGTGDTHEDRMELALKKWHATKDSSSSP